MRGVWVITRVTPNVSKITLVQRLEDKGKIPRAVFNLNVSKSLDVVIGLSKYVGERSLARSEATSRSNTRRGNHWLK